VERRQAERSTEDESGAGRPTRTQLIGDGPSNRLPQPREHLVEGGPKVGIAATAEAEQIRGAVVVAGTRLAVPRD